MKRWLCASALALGMVFCVVDSNAYAAARTFVSVSGNDLNDCSNVATPCRTFDAAVTQVDATGEVIVLTTGSYGGLTIGKAVKLDAPAGVVAFLAGTITVNAAAADTVVIRGLTIKALTPGTGTGILMTGAGTLSVESCVIDGWDLGIDVSGANPRVLINGTTIRGSGSNGFWMRPSATGFASVQDSRFERNGFASDFCGISASANGQVGVRDSVFSNNVFGICSLAATGQVSAQNSLFSGQAAAAVQAQGTGITRSASNTVVNNAVGLSNSGSTLESLGDNTVNGNGTNTTGTITLVGAN